LQKRKNRP